MAPPILPSPNDIDAPPNGGAEAGMPDLDRLTRRRGKTMDARGPLRATLILGLALSAPALADADGERAALVRLLEELDALEPAVAAAERQADPAARTRFAYDWLRADLARMRQGIRDHVERPRTEPQPVAPMAGESGR
jgi:RAQPRD family integrative conjugative element protein